MTADSIADEDDPVAAAAREVLERDIPEGTEDVRRGETDDENDFVPILPAYPIEFDFDISGRQSKEVRRRAIERSTDRGLADVAG